MLQLLYLTGLFVVAGAGLFFERFSLGFAAKTDHGPFFCKELLSSGGDDDAMVLLLAVFLGPALFRVLRWRRSVGTAETALFADATILASGALFSAALDCAQPLYTAFQLRDPALLAASAGFLVSVASLIGLRTP